MGGMVLETNMSEITTRIDEQNKLEKQEVSLMSKYKIWTYFGFNNHSCSSRSIKMFIVIEFQIT
jgi:hypothetical protein